MKKLLLIAMLFSAATAFAQAPQPDPCSGNAANKKTVNINTTANVQLATGQASRKIYVCSVFIAPMPTATNIAFATGTGTVCATGIAGFITGGDGTAAKGANVAANGGWTYGNGQGTVAKGATVGDNLCLLVSAANQISGSITYVLAP